MTPTMRPDGLAGLAGVSRTGGSLRSSCCWYCWRRLVCAVLCVSVAHRVNNNPSLPSSVTRIGDGQAVQPDQAAPLRRARQHEDSLRLRPRQGDGERYQRPHACPRSPNPPSSLPDQRALCRVFSAAAAKWHGLLKETSQSSQSSQSSQCPCTHRWSSTPRRRQARQPSSSRRRTPRAPGSASARGSSFSSVRLVPAPPLAHSFSPLSAPRTHCSRLKHAALPAPSSSRQTPWPSGTAAASSTPGRSTPAPSSRRERAAPQLRPLFCPAILRRVPLPLPDRAAAPPPLGSASSP